MLRQSRLQRDGLLGGLIVVFLIALVRGYPGAQTTTGRIVLVAFVSVVTAALAVGWVRLIRRPYRLEISSQTITLADGQGTTRTLSRRSGDELRLVSLGSGRYRQYGLTIRGADTVLPLPFFSAKASQAPVPRGRLVFPRPPLTSRVICRPPSQYMINRPPAIPTHDQSEFAVHRRTANSLSCDAFSPDCGWGMVRGKGSAYR